MSSGFSFKPTSSCSSSSSSTQFSQEWARRKVVVKHSIKSNQTHRVSWLWMCVYMAYNNLGVQLIGVNLSLYMCSKIRKHRRDGVRHVVTELTFSAVLTTSTTTCVKKNTIYAWICNPSLSPDFDLLTHVCLQFFKHLFGPIFPRNYCPRAEHPHQKFKQYPTPRGGGGVYTMENFDAI